MTAPKPTDDSEPAAPAAGKEPPVPTVSGESVEANRLTPEEQLARFEKELKENDWGHQPC